MVLKFAPGKKVGGWSEAERRGAPTLFHLNTIEVGDRLQELGAHCNNVL